MTGDEAGSGCVAFAEPDGVDAFEDYVPTGAAKGKAATARPGTTARA